MIGVRPNNLYNAPNPKREEILELLREGNLSTAEIGRRLGVTKNVVIGTKARAGLSVPPCPISTLWTRMDELHRRMDAVLKETAGIPRIPYGPGLASSLVVACLAIVPKIWLDPLKHAMIPFQWHGF
jgi:hypothetical protein